MLSDVTVGAFMFISRVRCGSYCDTCIPSPVLSTHILLSSSTMMTLYNKSKHHTVLLDYHYSSPLPPPPHTHTGKSQRIRKSIPLGRDAVQLVDSRGMPSKESSKGEYLWWLAPLCTLLVFDVTVVVIQHRIQ